MKKDSTDEGKLNEAYEACLERGKLNDFVIYKHFDFHGKTDYIINLDNYRIIFNNFFFIK